jgi:hypothetical protein
MGDNYSGRRELYIIRNKGVRNLVLVLCGLVLFLLSMNGVIENSIGKVLRIERVSESSQEFLEKSLITAMGHFAGLSTIKSGLYVIRDTSILGVSVGKIVSPLSDTIHFIWKLFGWAMLIIIGQMALLNFFRIVGIRVFFAAGALVFALSFNSIEFLRDLGISLMIIGFIFYSLMPFSVYMGKVMFEKSAEAANETLEKNLEEVKDKVSGIKLLTFKNLRPSRMKEAFFNIGGGLSEGLNILIKSLMVYLGNLMIMFVITPLFFYGMVYCLIKRVLSCIGMSRISMKVDEIS